MCGVADITQQHTSQVTARSARLECGWLALAYRTVAAAWIERRLQTSPNITLLKEGRRGRWAEHVTRMGGEKTSLNLTGGQLR